MEYTVVVEKSPRNYAAYVPDLPGCVATGTSREEAVREIRQAIRFHLESLREHGEPVPEPRCTATVVNVAAARRTAVSALSVQRLPIRTPYRERTGPPVQENRP